jgi:LAO/AO transport system kinase
MATRGSFGGLAQATGDTALLLDAAGKDIILIETVGVGQAEIEVVRIAHCTLVVLVPGMGDDVQSLKAGLMEIGDIFVLNKSDREGADRFEHQLKGILQLVPERDGWKPPVVPTIATENKGVAELGRQIEAFRKHFEQAHGRQAREIAHWKEWILQLLETRLMERVAGKYLGEKELDAIAAAVAERKTDPYAAVNEILARAGLGETR